MHPRTRPRGGPAGTEAPSPKRRLGAGTALVLALLVIAGSFPVGYLLFERPSPPPRARTPIQHVVEIMMENHGFDNLFGTFPGALGFPANATAPNGTGGTVRPYWIPGSSTADPPHDRGSELADLDGGRMDGFVTTMAEVDPAAADTPMGYYNGSQVPGYWSLASTYTLCDKYFASFLGPTNPNRLYALAGSSGGLSSNVWPSGGVELRTIFDQLSGVGLSWRYYYVPDGFPPVPLHVEPLASLPREAANVVPMSGLFPSIGAGDLPAVTFVDPSGSGTLSEHPSENVTVGEVWSLSVIDAIEASPLWNSTAIFLTWDEGGGFYDSVVPPVVDPWGDGFRVPLLVVSPYTRGGGVDSETFDHTSILAFIDSNWGLPPLDARVAAAHSVGDLFHFPLPAGAGADGWARGGPATANAPAGVGTG